MSRGAYRAIHTVLLDGPDYQALTPEAKLVLLTLKLNLGPSGIDVLYPAVLEPQTGLSARQIARALDELARGEWIRRERNLVWIVTGLRHEPSRSLTNANHRKEIGEHLDALPRLPIVDAFRAFYGLAEPAAATPANGIGGGMPQGMGNGMGDGIPKHGEREKGKKGGTEKGRVAAGAAPDPSGAAPAATLPAPDPAPAVVAELPAWLYLHGEWEKFVGPVDKGRFRKAFRPLAEPEGGAPLPYPLTTLRTAIEWYAAKRRGTREWEFVGAERFVSGVTEHVRIARLDMQDRVKVLPLPAGAV